MIVRSAAFLDGSEKAAEPERRFSAFGAGF
jgi:hypothetical protein